MSDSFQALRKIEIEVDECPERRGASGCSNSTGMVQSSTVHSILTKPTFRLVTKENPEKVLFETFDTSRYEVDIQNRPERFAKRAVDVVVSGLLFALTLPLLVVVSC